MSDIRSRLSQPGSDRSSAGRPAATDRSSQADRLRQIQSNRPNMDNDRFQRPSGSDAGRSSGDVRNRFERGSLSGESSTPSARRPAPSREGSAGDASALQERLRRSAEPNRSATDLRNRFDRGSRSESGDRSSVQDRQRSGAADRSSPAVRPGNADAIRERIEQMQDRRTPGDRSATDSPTRERPRPQRPEMGDADREDRGSPNRTDDARSDLRDRLTLPDRDRSENRPGDRPGTRPAPDAEDRLDSRNRGGDDRQAGDRQTRDRRPVRPDFDWQERAQRDENFRERLRDVQQRGVVDSNTLRDRLGAVSLRGEDGFDGRGDRDRDGRDRGDRDRDGRGDRDGDRGRDRDGRGDRDWDWNRHRDWNRDHRHYIPDYWHRHAWDVRHNHRHHHRFRYGWYDGWRPNYGSLTNWYFHSYRPRPGYWWAWASPYRLSTWYFWDNYPTAPIYYDYGTSIVYDTQYVYVQDEPIATREQYALQAIALANEGRNVLKNRPPVEGQGNPEDWLPLGVFVLTQTDSGEGDIYLQLAVDREGLLAGTYFNASSGNSLPVWGKVDPATQRAAWLIGDSSATVMDTGIYNLSQDVSTVLIHYGVQRQETWLLVRLPEEPIDP